MWAFVIMLIACISMVSVAECRRAVPPPPSPPPLPPPLQRITSGGDEAKESDESKPAPAEEARRPRTTPLVNILELEQCAQLHPERLLHSSNQHTKFVVRR